MRRVLLLLAFILCSAIGTRGQGTIFQLNPPAPNAQVYFCPVPDGGYLCPVQTTAYSDSATTQVVAQPISLGSAGVLTVYFAAGVTSVTVQLAGPGYGPRNRQVVTLGGGGIAAAAIAGNTNSTYLSPACPNPSSGNCFFAYFDTQYALADVTCNNGSFQITTGATDPPFKATDVGLVIAGITSTPNTAPNCPPQGTIATFIDAHNVTVSASATGTTTTGSLAWGHDDGAAIQTAFNASLGKGCLYLPQGNAFFSLPPFLDQRTQPKGAATCVLGTGQTLLTPTPSFSYTNCVTNGACVFTWPNGANQNPNYALLKDFEIFGLSYNLTGTGTNNNVFNLQRVTMENVWLWHWGNSIGTGMNFIGPDSAFSPIADSSGATNCAFNGSGANQTTQLFTPFCGENGISVVIANGAFLESFGGQYGPGFNANAETVNGHWLSVGEVHFQPSGTNDTIRVGTTGSLVLDDAQVIGAASNTFGAVDCNGSGGKVQIRGKTTIDGGTGGVALRSVAGCTIINDSGGMASIVQGTFSLSGNSIGQPSETQTGSCTTNAATVTFKNVYSIAPLVTVSVTTSGSTGAQATATNTTTATIHCNGASDAFVATVFPNPI